MAKSEYLNTKEIARLIGVSYRTVQGWRNKGIGPAYFRLPNGHIRYKHEAVVAWIEANKIEDETPLAA